MTNLIRVLGCAGMVIATIGGHAYNESVITLDVAVIATAVCVFVYSERAIVAIVLVILAPVALPLLAVAVWLDNTGRRQEMPRARYGTWFWRIWWWYGYHGLYQIDWWRKRRGIAT